jgi:hypothetical protein
MPPDGDQWLTLSELAKRENVVASVVSRKIARFEARGELKPRLDGRKAEGSVSSMIIILTSRAMPQTNIHVAIPPIT